jgi:hypothetical protein
VAEPISRLPGALRELGISGEALAATVTLRLAEATEGVAKHKLNERSHAYGTPTPATQGGPPAKISGDLMRSVTHEPTGPSEAVRVGPSDVPHRRYPPKTQSRGGTLKPTAGSGAIGRYLEEDLGYPWLEPSADEVMAAAEPIVNAAIDELLRW